MTARTFVSPSGRIAACGALLLLALSPYLASGFALDDFFHLEWLAASDSNLRFALDTRAEDIVFWPLDHDLKIEFWRPLVDLSFRLDSALWGSNPTGFHLTNLLLHLVNAILIAAVARRAGSSTSVAGLAALLWGVSVHAAPAVGWISGRTELLTASMTLAGALSILHWASGGRTHALLLAAGFALLACLGKESGVVSPILMAIPVLVARRALGSTRVRTLGWRHGLLLAAPSLGYVALRLTQGDVALPPEPYADTWRGLAGFPELGVKAALYVVAALTGLPLFPRAAEGWFETRPAAALGLEAGALVAAVRLATWRRGGEPLLLLWGIVALVPYALIMAASLYLYLPLMGTSWWLARAFQARRGVAMRLWIGWLITTGVLGHALAATYLRRVSLATDHAAAAVTDLAARRDVRNLVLLDAPVWAYSLPAAVRLRSSAPPFRTYFVNFAPGVTPHPPTAPYWDTDLVLRLESPSRPLFESAVERFFLFGSDPLQARGALTEPLFTVIPDRARGGVRSLRLVFASALTTSGTALLQFHGWDPVELKRTDSQ